MPPRRRNQQFSPLPAAPLSEIRLTNFKSVRSATVQLRPLTAIVGRNSSGKSTLIQGILALTQAVRAEVATQTFPLNGDLVRLGTFDEVRSFDADPDAGIEIGFTAEFTEWASGTRMLDDDGRLSGSGVSVSWDAHLEAQVESLGVGQALLDTIEFVARPSEHAINGGAVELTISGFRHDGDAVPVAVGPTEAFPLFDERSEFSVDGRVSDRESGESSRVDLVRMSGGLPRSIFRLGTTFNVVFRTWWDLVFEELEDDRHQARQATADGLAHDDTRDSTREQLEADVRTAVGFAASSLEDAELVRRLAAPGRSVRSARRRRQDWPAALRPDAFIDELDEAGRRSVANAMNELGEVSFRQRVRVRLEESQQDWLDDVIRDAPLPERSRVLEFATLGAVGLFRRVRYLGPLRAKPQVMYSPGVGQFDLGPEGELAAAYLHEHSHDNVLVPIPAGGVHEMTLGDALNLWLEELGLADGASARDRGRLGIGLYVQPAGRSQSVDLTSVGVGVSQALPVVLLCLRASPGSVVLLEQPELHLHPAMQLKLADFLLACARAGRQIVVETHSEHLINRLRLHVAADESTDTSDVIRFLFAEQESGETVYRISDVNEVGGLSSDWPSGFLDVAAEESTRLLEQSLARRRASAERKD